MDAHGGTEVVPDLQGMAEAKATSTLGKTSLKLEIDPNGSKDPDAIVEFQHPSRGTSVPKGSSVQVTLTPTATQPAPQPEPPTQPQA
jgi:beta-lactam-binding protein with PASTA domain